MQSYGNPFSSVPPEILKRIIFYLDMESHLFFIQTCKAFLKQGNASFLEMILQNDFALDNLNKNKAVIFLDKLEIGFNCAPEKLEQDNKIIKKALEIIEKADINITCSTGIFYELYLKHYRERTDNFVLYICRQIKYLPSLSPQGRCGQLSSIDEWGVEREFNKHLMQNPQVTRYLKHKHTWLTRKAVQHDGSKNSCYTTLFKKNCWKIDFKTSVVMALGLTYFLLESMGCSAELKIFAITLLLGCILLNKLKIIDISAASARIERMSEEIKEWTVKGVEREVDRRINLYINSL